MTPAPDFEDFSIVEVPLWPWHYHHFTPPGHPDHSDMFHCNLHKRCESCRRYNHIHDSTTTFPTSSSHPPEFHHHQHHDHDLYLHTSQPPYWQEPPGAGVSLQVVQQQQQQEQQDCPPLMCNVGSSDQASTSTSSCHARRQLIKFQIHKNQPSSLISELTTGPPTPLSHHECGGMMRLNDCKVFPNSSCYICSETTDDILMYSSIYDMPTSQETLLIVPAQQQQRQVTTTTSSNLDKGIIMNTCMHNNNSNGGVFHHSACSNSMNTSNYNDVHNNSVAAAPPPPVTNNPQFCSQIYQLPAHDFYNHNHNNYNLPVWSTDVNNYCSGFNSNFSGCPRDENCNANFYTIKQQPCHPPCVQQQQQQQQKPQKHKKWKKASTLPKHKRVSSSTSSSYQQFPNSNSNNNFNQQSLIPTADSSSSDGGDKSFWQKFGPSSSGTLDFAEGGGSGGSNRIVQPKFNNPPLVASAASTNFEVGERVVVVAGGGGGGGVAAEKSIECSPSPSPPLTFSSSPKYQNFQTLDVKADALSPPPSSTPPSSSANQEFPVQNIENISEQQCPVSTEDDDDAEPHRILEHKQNVENDDHLHVDLHGDDDVDADGISSDSNFPDVPELISNNDATTLSLSRKESSNQMEFEIEEINVPHHHRHHHHLESPVRETIGQSTSQETAETPSQSLLDELKNNNNNNSQKKVAPSSVLSNFSKKVSAPTPPPPVKIGRSKLDKRQDEPKKVCKAKQRPFLLKEKLTEKKFEEVRHGAQNLTKRPASIDFQAKFATITCPKQRCKKDNNNGGGEKGCCCNRDEYRYSKNVVKNGHEKEPTFRSAATPSNISPSSAATFVSFRGRKPGENTEIYLAALIPFVLDPDRQEGALRQVRRSKALDTRQVGVQTE